MKFIDEFKAFVSRGNVIDLAVGVVIGGAFGKIVSSLVSDIIMPVISLLTSSTDFTNLKLILVPATETKTELALTYGNFLQNIIDFLLIAFSIFIVIKLMARFQKKEAAKPVEEPKADPTVVLLTEIRDLLKKTS
ncbi:Large-conductance mechanosensitive channel [bioreactor metagenome]|uniref:Large-conductance mechanosensitive channel n=1 Tax=bioreactor metagenome TaxID=1076179 RepID=A0A644YCL1_9ZZZZ|nr:large-conductance mechanosensitive channel protein MscL [Erysipelotrichaceae bacterium]